MGNDVKKIMEETTKEIVEAQTEHPKRRKNWVALPCIYLEVLSLPLAWRR